MTRLTKILLSLLAVIIIIQFFRPEKNQAKVEQPGDIFTLYPATDTVKQLVKTACYDCHSNNTVYPWYAEVQPVAWWLANHIDEGKHNLNFSEFASYSAKKADHKLEEAIEEVEKKDMPLKSYTLIHKDADLDEGQRQAIKGWMESVRQQIKKGSL